MIESGILASLLTGGLLGVVFFGGLWWTVQRAVSVHRVGLWFFGSLLLRTVIVLAGFHLGCGSDWRRWLSALLGFTVARLVIVRLTRPLADIAQGNRAS